MCPQPAWPGRWGPSWAAPVLQGLHMQPGGRQSVQLSWESVSRGRGGQAKGWDAPLGALAVAGLFLRRSSSCSYSASWVAYGSFSSERVPAVATELEAWSSGDGRHSVSATRRQAKASVGHAAALAAHEHRLPSWRLAPDRPLAWRSAESYPLPANRIFSQRHTRGSPARHTGRVTHQHKCRHHGADHAAELGRRRAGLALGSRILFADPAAEQGAQNG